MKALLVVAALSCAAPALAQFDDDVGELLGIGTAGGAPVAGPSFDFNPDLNGSGPSLLPAIVVNGTTMTPLVDCRGEQVSGTNLVCATGGTFAEGNSGGASPTSALAVPFVESAARGVTFTASGKAYVAASGTVGNVTTEDLAFDFIAQNPGAGYSIAGNYTGVANGGWELVWSGGNSVSLTTQIAGGASQSCGTAATLATGAWYHVMLFVDRSANCRAYVNGVQSGTPTASTTTSIASANTLVLAGRPGSAGQTGPQILSRFTMSSCAGCLNTTAEMDAIAAQRFAQLTGVAPTIAKGTVLATTATRASLGYADIDRSGDGNRRLFLLGNGWMRTVRRANVTGGAFHSGYLAEPTSTNLALQSQTFDSASWTKLNVTATADTTVAPDLTTTADSMAQTANAGVVAHCFTQAITLTAAGYNASVFLKASTRSFAYVNDSTIANGAAWINLSTCAAGTVQAGVPQADTGSYGNGWCRLGIEFTATAAAHTIQICAANADNTTTYDGGAGTATQIIAWGAQVEAIAQTRSATSYIATTSASVTRAGDLLTFKGNDGNVPVAGYTVAALHQCPNDLTPNAGPGLWEVATNATNYLQFYDDNSVRMNGIAFTGGVAQINKNFFVDVSDGNTHETRAVYFPSFAQVYLDGATNGSGAVTITMQPSPTGIELGHYLLGAGGAGQGGCSINRLRILPTQRTDATVLP